MLVAGPLGVRGSQQGRQEKFTKRTKLLLLGYVCFGGCLVGLGVATDLLEARST